ncbi:hypothetical protein H0H92_013396 [Tricholoma furcatifolium]|nr:hypothetical protein H0H92_013396 [Tricholoma furcatifolium]
MGPKRRRQFQHVIDLNERDIEEQVLISNGRIQKTYVGYEPLECNKRQRTDATPSTSTSPQASTAMTPAEKATHKPLAPQTSKKQASGASEHMKQFDFVTLQHDILSRFYHPRVGGLCRCKKPAAVYRCLQCSRPPPLCQECIVSDHTYHPYHVIQEWTGKFFKQTSLMDLGLIVQLGHDGEKCPNTDPKRDPMRAASVILVVDTYSVQQARFRYCYCHNHGELVPHHRQLVQSGVVPATTGHPETVFTFEVLDHFHISNLTSKKSAYDYFAGLRYLTDGAFPQAVPNRYRELLRVSRIWGHLAMVRRSGQAHGIDDMLGYRHPSSLTVRCPACPSVGFNVEQAVIDTATEEETHKYTLFLSADGNFRLQRKNKKDDPDDIALNEGNGYFVPTETYKNYCALVKETAPEKGSACAHLRAAKMQNIVKFKNAAVSGVVAVQCARHGFYMSQGVVDLIKGETCLYGVNLNSRFKTWFESLEATVPRIRGAIPKMHVANHVESCLLLYGFNYMSYSGETWGENIEGGWAELNQSAGSTKEMNDGYRHDSLDDMFGFWNWAKLNQISSTLYRMYEANIRTFKTRESNFKSLTEMFVKHVAKWEAMDTKPTKVDGVVRSVYQVTTEGGVPTMQTVFESLLLKNSEGDASILVSVLKEGLDLEIRQLALRLQEDCKNDSKLESDIENWREHQLLHFPSLEDRVLALKQQESKAQDIDLLLPSSFTSEEWDSLQLNSAAEIERDLREGQAHDTLENLRLCIKAYNASLNFKKNNVFGQRPNTRAQKLLITLRTQSKHAMETYQVIYKKLLNLGLSDARLQPLDDTMLWAKNPTHRHELGSSKKVDPWYWHTGRPAGQSDDDWNTEMNRVKWFRDRAARDRSREEKELLEEEFRRTIVSFDRMAQVWNTISESSSKSPSPGHSAYAAKQSSIYRKLEADAQKTFDKAKKLELSLSAEDKDEDEENNKDKAENGPRFT